MRAEYWKYYPYSRIAYFRNVHCSNAEFRNTVRIYGENTISSETRTVFSNTVRISEIRISEMCISYKRVFQKCVSREYVFQDYGMYIRNTVRISKEYNPYFRSTFCIPEVLSAFLELRASELCIPGIRMPVILSAYEKYVPVALPGPAVPCRPCRAVPCRAGPCRALPGPAVPCRSPAVALP